MVALVSVAVNNPCTVLQIYNNAMGQKAWVGDL